MKTQEFDKFVERQQAGDADPKILEEWLAALDTLYAAVEGFLKKYTKAGKISYSFSAVELNEQLIGVYSAQRMNIRIGKLQHVSLVPVATMLVGCKGRVDVEGSSGTAQLLLVGKKAKNAADLFRISVRVGDAPPVPKPEPPTSWVWKIVSNSADRRFTDLDQESFFQLVLEVANA